jgi:cytochrome c oxidase subunit IV
MKTAEESNNLLQLAFDSSIFLLFKVFLELIIAVYDHEMWTHLATVHKLLESLVSCLLEIQVIIECKSNKVIDFLFEKQQSSSKL